MNNKEFEKFLLDKGLISPASPGPGFVFNTNSTGGGGSGLTQSDIVAALGTYLAAKDTSLNYSGLSAAQLLYDNGLKLYDLIGYFQSQIIYNRTGLDPACSRVSIIGSDTDTVNVYTVSASKKFYLTDLIIDQTALDAGTRLFTIKDVLPLPADQTAAITKLNFCMPRSISGVSEPVGQMIVQFKTPIQFSAGIKIELDADVIGAGFRYNFIGFEY